MPMLEFDDQFTMFDITPLENLFIDEYMPVSYTHLTLPTTDQV